jgi:BarA-like signal transduction histidine kinase
VLKDCFNSVEAQEFTYFFVKVLNLFFNFVLLSISIGKLVNHTISSTDFKTSLSLTKYFVKALDCTFSASAIAFNN